MVGNGRVVLIVADHQDTGAGFGRPSDFFLQKCPRLDIQPGCGLV